MSETNIHNPKQLELKSYIEKGSFPDLIPSESLKWKSYGLAYKCKPENFLKVATLLKEDPIVNLDMLIDVTCVDWLDSKDYRFEVVYQFLSIVHHYRLCIKLEVGEVSPKVPSVRSLWPAANFLEREVFDMYGITFEGHGDLRRILMYDEFIGHPLRKDYPLRGKQPRIELRVPELRNTSSDLKKEQLVGLPSRRKISTTTDSLN